MLSNDLSGDILILFVISSFSLKLNYVCKWLGFFQVQNKCLISLLLFPSFQNKGSGQFLSILQRCVLLLHHLDFVDLNPVLVFFHPLYTVLVFLVMSDLPRYLFSGSFFWSPWRQLAFCWDGLGLGCSVSLALIFRILPSAVCEQPPFFSRLQCMFTYEDSVSCVFIFLLFLKHKTVSCWITEGEVWQLRRSTRLYLGREDTAHSGGFNGRSLEEGARVKKQ